MIKGKPLCFYCLHFEPPGRCGCDGLILPDPEIEADPAFGPGLGWPGGCLEYENGFFMCSEDAPRNMYYRVTNDSS